MRTTILLCLLACAAGGATAQPISGARPNEPTNTRPSAPDQPRERSTAPEARVPDLGGLSTGEPRGDPGGGQTRTDPGATAATPMPPPPTGGPAGRP